MTDRSNVLSHYRGERSLLKTRCVTICLILAALGLAVAYDVAYSQPQTAEQNTAFRLIQTGAEQLHKSEYRSAANSFEQALRYNDASPEAHLGLGMAYYFQREDRYAERELLTVVELNPGDATAYQWLGDLFYRKDDLDTAVMWWEKAVALAPNDAKLRTRLERVQRENKTEKDFNRDVTSHFLIKYDGREKIEAGRIILRILEDAYGEVGRALTFYPEREIQVILYSGKQFQEVTEAPGWSGAIFDGKIRIPIGGIEQETPGLRKLLFHEYTHAVVGAIAPRCPTWLNEGLAQYLEGRSIDARQSEILRKMIRTEKVPFLANLEGSFMGMGSGQAEYAYLISLSAVRYMLEEYKMYRVKMLLEELAKGADMAKAINIGLTISYEDFERGWKRSLE